MITIGMRLGPYEIKAPLGSGGMGQVYRAYDHRLDREVAVKLLPNELADDAEQNARFEREVKALAALSHPNILAIHDYGMEQGKCFAVMELLEGQTLRQRIAEGPLPWRKTLEIGRAVAEGLAAAHAKGIIHRDLKPANLFLLSDGRVKILDFGLARIETPASSTAETGTYVGAHTEPGIIMGTVGYMSPEQVRGKNVDLRTDMFTFGIVLHEMISGTNPFLRETGAETMTAILRDDPPDLIGTIPAAVERIIRRCLEKNPEERFQSARDLAFAVKTVLDDSGMEDMPMASVRPKAGRKSRKTLDTIAILPFVNANADAEMEYLCDGLTETIINNLSQLPRLRVMARSTVFRYKGKQPDPHEVAQDLGVRAFLTGRVLALGDSLIISAELVDTRDGAYLWGDQFRTRLADLLEIQEEIATKITSKLKVKISGGEKKRLAKRPTANSEAYQLYLKGQYHFNKRTREDFDKAIDYFTEAIAQDADYGLAYVGLADACNLLCVYGFVTPDQVYAKSKAAVEKALQLDERLSGAHVALGHLKYYFEWDWPAAKQHFQRAIELNRNDANAYHSYAHCLMLQGELDEALIHLQRAQKLDPLALATHANIGYRLYLARQYDDAIAQFDKTLEMDPNFALVHFYLGQTYVQQGLHQQAVWSFEQALSLTEDDPGLQADLAYASALAGQRWRAEKILKELTAAQRDFVSPCFLALIHAGLGDTAQALNCLEEAFARRDPQVLYLRMEPMFDALRSELRFQTMIEQL